MNNGTKVASKKILIRSVIILFLTFVLGLIFIFNTNSDFVATKTIWEK